MVLKKKNRLYNLVVSMVVLIFVALIVSGLLVPIYGDEVSTKMTQATILSNGGRMLTAIPQCFPELTMRIPASWYPAAGIYQLLYNDLGPLAIRISGVVFALLFVFMVALGFKRLVPSNVSSATLLAVFVAVLGLGVLPLTLVLARSEQWLLLLLVYFIFFPLENKQGVQSFKAMQVIVFLICTSLFFFTHPKSAFFFPVVLVSALVGFQKNLRLQIITVTFAVVCLAQTVFAGRELFKCEDAPIIASSFASQTVSISTLAAQPFTLFKLFYIYLVTFPEKAIQYTVFHSAYFSTWLPSLPHGEELGTLELFINPMISASVLLVIVIGLILPPIAIFIAYFRGVSSHFHLLLGAIWVSLIAHLAIYINWNFYASVLPLGVLALLICLCLVDIPWSKNWRFFGVSIVIALSGVFLLSAFVLFSSLTPRLINLLAESNELGVPGQSLSVPTFRYPLQRERIRQFASLCGLKGDGATRLVVDDLTYLAFERLREPMHLAYISEKGMGQDIKGTELIRFLNSKGSSGIIAKCTLLPDAVRPYALEYENLCCVKLGEN
ncbi:MAG: hypothetical protein Q7T10_05695 [Rhodoferax sp.]|uniref:hypothetical protein n=1 Tax=Rhodoferax sp. TaxID=50421 RepID=UPI0027181302|nr:hypothetical protein [Rhodoferax sp.]MDO8448281.1 hypothetical protein [Rhodoferax sp.]